MTDDYEKAAFHVRWMIRRDMPEVLDIEAGSFEAGWLEEEFLHCLRQRNCIGMVAERGEKVVGFVIYQLGKAKLHVLNFAVHPAWRRQGVGGRMLTHITNKLASHRRTRAVLEVRETNLAAQLFFKSQGFKAVKVRRRRYQDTGEDAFVMRYRLRDHVLTN